MQYLARNQYVVGIILNPVRLIIVTLHLLRADKLEGGFYLDSSFTYADIQQSTLPSGISAAPDIGIELISNLIRKNNSAQTKSPMTLRMLVFSRQTANYKMTVTFHLEGKRKNLDVGSLNIFVNDKLALASPLSVASQISASLPLEADFNTVVLSSSRLPLILGHEDSTDDIENWIQLDLISIHQ